MVTESRNRPYAPAANVINLLQRLRTRNLPDEINSEYLQAVGFSVALSSRIRQALEFLGLINESGGPEDVLGSLVRSTDEEYRQILEGVIREAYRDVFDVVDPSQDPQDAVINAFRRFEPASQHYRMAVLFLGLCREAGIPILEEPRRREVQRATQRRTATTPRTARQRASAGGRTGGQAQVPSAPALSSPVLLGYIQRLPRPGSVFPLDEREGWIDGIRTAFRLEYQAEDEEVIEQQ